MNNGSYLLIITGRQGYLVTGKQIQHILAPPLRERGFDSTRFRLTVSGKLTEYSGIPLNGHPATADTHDIVR